MCILPTSEPLFYIDTHEVSDEVLGLLADVIPVGAVELKLS